MTTQEQLEQARHASRVLRTISTKQKDIFLSKLAELLILHTADILRANERDLEHAGDITQAMRKRLTLTETSIKGIADGVSTVLKLKDPVGSITTMSQQPNGMQVGRMRVPIGVIFFVYESRPNVLVDAAALCVKSGNVLLARGGKEALASNNALLVCIQESLVFAGMPHEAVQQLEDRSYNAITEVVQSPEFIDLVVPRGREDMIRTIKEKARVPVIAHERGLCHAYIDAHADKRKALRIIINAKTSNPSTCNTIETVLVHKDIADSIMPELIVSLVDAGVEVRGCERTCSYDARCILATEDDWKTEYLDMIVSIKIVDTYDEAVEHIEAYSSGLTDSIITEDYTNARLFTNQIHSAAVLVNASNRLVDGGQFGLGAELGISTSSIHMKGPMGIEDLTVTKYIVLGDGQIRE